MSEEVLYLHNKIEQILESRSYEVGDVIATEKVSERKKKAISLVSEILQEDFGYVWVGDKKGFFAIQRNNVYVKNVYREIRYIIRKFLKSMDVNDTDHTIELILSAVRDNNSYPINDFIPYDENLVVCNNGVLDFKNFKIVYSDNVVVKTFNKIPYDINESADCPKFRKFLHKVFADHDDPYETEQLIFEMIGYILQYKIDMQKAFILTSREGGTGKSSLINIILHLISKSNSVKIPLQKIVMDKFALGPAQFKQLLYFTDLPTKIRIDDTGVLKDLITDDELIIERKGYDAEYQKNILKLLFAANGLPYVKNIDSAFARRWVIIDFNIVLDPRIPNWEFENIINDENEMQGILINAFYAYQCLMERGYFNGQTTEEIKERWLMEVDDVYRFMKNECETDPSYFIPKEKLHEAYIDYCNDEGIIMSAGDLNKFTRRLKTFGITITQRRINNRKERCYSGINLISEIVHDADDLMEGIDLVAEKISWEEYF